MGYLMLLGLCLNANYNENIVDEAEDEEEDILRKKRRKGLIRIGVNFKLKKPTRIVVK